MLLLPVSLVAKLRSVLTRGGTLRWYRNASGVRAVFMAGGSSVSQNLINTWSVELMTVGMFTCVAALTVSSTLDP